MIIEEPVKSVTKKSEKIRNSINKSSHSTIEKSVKIDRMDIDIDKKHT